MHHEAGACKSAYRAALESTSAVKGHASVWRRTLSLQLSIKPWATQLYLPLSGTRVFRRIFRNCLRAGVLCAVCLETSATWKLGRKKYHKWQQVDFFIQYFWFMRQLKLQRGMTDCCRLGRSDWSTCFSFMSCTQCAQTGPHWLPGQMYCF